MWGFIIKFIGGMLLSDIVESGAKKVLGNDDDDDDDDDDD